MQAKFDDGLKALTDTEVEKEGQGSLEEKYRLTSEKVLCHLRIFNEH